MKHGWYFFNKESFVERLNYDSPDVATASNSLPIGGVCIVIGEDIFRYLTKSRYQYWESTARATSLNDLPIHPLVKAQLLLFS